MVINEIIITKGDKELEHRYFRDEDVSRRQLEEYGENYKNKIDRDAKVIIHTNETTTELKFLQDSVELQNKKDISILDEGEVKEDEEKNI